MDVLGQLQYVGVPSDDKLVINTSVFPSGVYVLRVTLRDGAVRTTRVVKR